MHARRLINQRQLPYLVLALLFLLNLWFAWPGQMTPDSIGQYHMATTGIYDDHHPPIMSVWWGVLDGLRKGPGLLLLFHLLLLYGACAIFMCIFQASRLRWLYVAFPVWPQIALYSSMIWKDVGFAFCFLLVSAMLSFFIMRRNLPSIGAYALMGALLFYGVAVKFQAQFVVPFLLLGVAYCMTRFTFTKKTFAITGIMYAVLSVAISLFNNHYVPAASKSHSWQFVKFYDLAAISVYTNQLLFSDGVQKHPYYSFENIKQRFTHEKVDDLYFCADSPLKKADTDEDRRELYHAWLANVLKYPHLYLMHRAKNFMYMLKARPLQKLETVDLHSFGGLRWLAQLQDAAQSNSTNVLHYAGKMFFFCLNMLSWLCVFGFLLPFIMLYFCLGLYYVRTERAAMPLLIMNGMSLMLLLVLFFFSMAGMMRYVYIIVCMTHASHAFAYTVFKKSSHCLGATETIS